MAAITLTILARNAAATIEKCLASAAPYVDRIIVGFGGESTDDTERIVRDWLTERIPGDRPDTWPARKHQVFSIDWHDDFAAARNEILDRVETEWMLWLDADDELLGGDMLARNIEANPAVNCFWAPYKYDEDEYGNVSTTLWRERLVKNPPDWRWTGAVHEFLELNPSVPLNMTPLSGVAVIHQPGRNKDKGTRNLDILYRELERTEPDPSQRLLFYLFRENASRGNLKEALLHANRYISRASFEDEAYQMAYGIADTQRAQGDLQKARWSAMRAISMNPKWPDAYFLLARIAYEQGRPEETIEWTKAGETKEPPQTSVIIDPRSYTYWPVYFLGLAYRALGDWEMALPNLQRAASVVPDQQIMALIGEAQQKLSEQKVLDAFHTLHEHLGRNDEWLKARKLFEVAPHLIASHESVVTAWAATEESTRHVEDPQIMIDFYTGNPHWAPMPEELVWNPDRVNHPRQAFAMRSVTCEPPATILDIGSSDGFISLPMAQMGHIVEGWDLDPRCVDLANERAQAKGLRAHYNVGSIENVEGKFDVALALEIIEHLVDPASFLDQVDEHARKVVITTPHLAWEGGRVDDWAKVEPKGHIRIFDLEDVERLVAPRGRILDLYRQAWGPSGWIFVSYRTRQTYAGTVTFLAPGTLEEWSPRKLQAEGLGGSETALIRLAEELFYAGGDDTKSQLCTVYGRIDEPGYYNGVRYRPMEQFMPEVGADVLVAWRYPEAADLALRAKRLFLWVHDTDFGDRLTPVRAARFEKIVVLSEWHRRHMIETYQFLLNPGMPEIVVIGNGVDLERFGFMRGDIEQPLLKIETYEAPKREPHRVVYTSSPDRGLDAILEHVWPKVVEQVPDAELHVYYGWNNYRAVMADYPHMQQFYTKCAGLLIDAKNVVQHGRIPQGELARELEQASVWLYPSHNFDETFCISAVEAQLAGAIPVTTNRGALAETVQSGVVIEGTIGVDEGVTERYVDEIVNILLTDTDLLEEQREQVRAAAPALAWEEVSRQWVEILSDDTRTTGRVDGPDRFHSGSRSDRPAGDLHRHVADGEAGHKTKARSRTKRARAGQD